MSKSNNPTYFFPSRLRSARAMRGLNQEQLARRTNLQVSAVSLFETGSRKPSFDNLKRLADALNVTTDYLIGRVDDPVGSTSDDIVYRHLGQLSESDREIAEEMIEMLVRRSKERGKRVSEDDD